MTGSMAASGHDAGIVSARWRQKGRDWSSVSFWNLSPPSVTYLQQREHHLPVLPKQSTNWEPQHSNIWACAGHSYQNLTSVQKVILWKCIWATLVNMVLERKRRVWVTACICSLAFVLLALEVMDGWFLDATHWTQSAPSVCYAREMLVIS